MICLKLNRNPGLVERYFVIACREFFPFHTRWPHKIFPWGTTGPQVALWELMIDYLVGLLRHCITNTIWVFSVQCCLRTETHSSESTDIKELLSPCCFKVKVSLSFFSLVLCLLFDISVFAFAFYTTSVFGAHYHNVCISILCLLALRFNIVFRCL